MSKLYELMNEINEKVEDLINEEFQTVRPDALNLDRRSGYWLQINEDYIAARKDEQRSLEYYGGFEYVDKEHVTVLGDYVFYSADDERVQGHLDEFFIKEENDN
jgi:hypothetical protein